MSEPESLEKNESWYRTDVFLLVGDRVYFRQARVDALPCVDLSPPVILGQSLELLRWHTAAER